MSGWNLIPEIEGGGSRANRWRWIKQGACDGIINDPFLHGIIDDGNINDGNINGNINGLLSFVFDNLTTISVNSEAVGEKCFMLQSPDLHMSKAISVSAGAVVNHYFHLFPTFIGLFAQFGWAKSWKYKSNLWSNVSKSCVLD